MATSEPAYVCISATWLDNATRTKSLQALAVAIKTELGQQFAMNLLESPKITLVSEGEVFSG